jgi:hypothetical protein
MGYEMKKLAAALVTAISPALAMTAGSVAVAPPAHACTVVSRWGVPSVTSAGPGETCMVCTGLACTNGPGNVGPAWGPASPAWVPAYGGEACYPPILRWLVVCQG